MHYESLFQQISSRSSQTLSMLRTGLAIRNLLPLTPAHFSASFVMGGHLCHLCEAANRQEVEYSRSFPGLKTFLGETERVRNSPIFMYFHIAFCPAVFCGHGKDVQYQRGACGSGEPTGTKGGLSTSSFHNRGNKHPISFPRDADGCRQCFRPMILRVCWLLDVIS